MRLNGHPDFRRLRFVEIDEKQAKEEDIDPGCWLYVTLGRAERQYEIPFWLAATSEQIAILVEFAASVARIHAARVPTLLILDIGWNWTEGFFDRYAEYLLQLPCQVVIVHQEFPSDLSKPVWEGWHHVTIKRGKDGSEFVQE